MPKSCCPAFRRPSRSFDGAARLQRELAWRDRARLATGVHRAVTHDPSQPARRGNGLEVPQSVYPRRRPHFAIETTAAAIGPHRRAGAGHQGGYYRFVTDDVTLDRDAGTSYPAIRMGREFAFRGGR